MKVILNKRINQDLIKINQYKNLSFLSFLPSFSLPPSLPPSLPFFLYELSHSSLSVDEVEWLTNYTPIKRTIAHSADV